MTTRPADAAIREMLEARAAGVPSSATREVLAGARAEIAGSLAPGGEAVAFRVRPVEGARGRSRMPWGVAVLATAAVVAVALLGGRAQLEQPQASAPTTGGSPEPAASGGSRVIGGPISPEELGSRLRAGELDGKTVVVDGRAFLAQGRCRSAEPCMFLRIDGLADAWIDLGGRTPDAAQAAIDRFGQTAPVVLHGSGGGLRLLGWLVGGNDGPYPPEAERLRALTGDDPEALVDVLGWLQATNGAVRLSTEPDGAGRFVAVSVDPSFPPADMEPAWGRFLVRPATALRLGTPAAWSVVGRIDPANRVEVDRPRANLEGTTISAAALMAALEDGSLDGQVLAIDGELSDVAWPCPLDAAPCARYFVQGLPGVAITWDGGIAAANDSGGSGVSPMAGRILVTPRHGRLQPQVGYLELLGILHGALDRPISLDDLAANAPAGTLRDPFAVDAVDGWLVVDGPIFCPLIRPGGTPCPQERSLLTPSQPDASGGLTSPDNVRVRVHRAAPGIGDLPIREAGPFLVREATVGSTCNPTGEPQVDAACAGGPVPGWLVVGRDDPAGVRVVTFP